MTWKLAGAKCQIMHLVRSVTFAIYLIIQPKKTVEDGAITTSHRMTATHPTWSEQSPSMMESPRLAAMHPIAPDDDISRPVVEGNNEATKSVAEVHVDREQNCAQTAQKKTFQIQFR